MDLVSTIQDQLNNQFVGGGLMLMVAGSAIALMKDIPRRLWFFIKRRTTITVEVLNTDPCFDYVTYWLDQQPYSKRSRTLTATTRSAPSDGEDVPSRLGDSQKKPKPSIILTPAPGVHVFFYNSTFICLTREREKEAVKGSGGATLLKKSESYTFRVIARKQKVIRDLLEEIVDVGTVQDENHIKLFHSSFGYWDRSGILKPRKLESVVLPESLSTKVLNRIKEFLASADWYHEIGIPWHLGVLLYGLPGTGKSSLAVALAGELKMNLYLLSLSGGMNDEKLSELMANVQPGSIVLMEDVDTTFPDRDADKTKGVTLSGLLNVLDGVQSKDGCIIFMTTNKIETLDSALLRPGRVDLKIEFTKADESQILRLRDRIKPDVSDEDVLAACLGKTTAETQQFLLDTRMDTL